MRSKRNFKWIERPVSIIVVVVVVVSTRKRFTASQRTGLRNFSFILVQWPPLRFSIENIRYFFPVIRERGDGFEGTRGDGIRNLPSTLVTLGGVSENHISRNRATSNAGQDDIFCLSGNVKPAHPARIISATKSIDVEISNVAVENRLTP